LPGLDKLRHGGHSSHALEFARISYGLNEYQAVAALATCVRFFDLQDPSSDRTLLDLNEGKTRILDLAAVPAGAQESPIRVLVTDKEVIWLDIRKAANPVLRFKHRREEAMDLRLSAVCDGGSACYPCAESMHTESGHSPSNGAMVSEQLRDDPIFYTSVGTRAASPPPLRSPWTFVFKPLCRSSASAT
jgi:hypothetical protein